MLACTHPVRPEQGLTREQALDQPAHDRRRACGTRRRQPAVALGGSAYDGSEYTVSSGTSVGLSNSSR
jgi:hypothetical protein